MGYHRPTSTFNIGKQGEHAERVFFREKSIRPQYPPNKKPAFKFDNLSPDPIQEGGQEGGKVSLADGGLVAETQKSVLPEYHQARVL